MIGYEEVIKEDIKYARLTIAKERVTLKLLPDTPAYLHSHLRDFSREIAREMQPTLEKTMRGCFKDPNHIRLSSTQSHQRTSKTFTPLEVQLYPYEGENPDGENEGDIYDPRDVAILCGDPSL